MTEHEILEGNKLIAYFMGHSVYGFQKNDLNTNILRCLFNPTEFKEAEINGYRLQFPYGNSFDSLMPVVDKIVNHGHGTELNILTDYCCFYVYDSFGESQIIQVEGKPTAILATYLAVIEFIKWFNTQNKS